jgi:hypothetical protein
VTGAPAAPLHDCVYSPVGARPDSARPMSGRDGPLVGRVIEPLPNAL